jgi:hypothetical protein
VAAVRVDLSQFTLPVIAASDQEAAAHEDVLKQLDKASGGKTLWRAQEPVGLRQGCGIISGFPTNVSRNG